MCFCVFCICMIFLYVFLPLTVSCFSKIQIGFTFLVPAYPGSPGQKAIKRVYVRMYVCFEDAKIQ